MNVGDSPIMVAAIEATDLLIDNDSELTIG